MDSVCRYFTPMSWKLEARRGRTNLEQTYAEGRFAKKAFDFGRPRRSEAVVDRIELVDHIGLDYTQKHRGFERFSQPEAIAIEDNFQNAINS